jgi:hypothetical protein
MAIPRIGPLNTHNVTQLNNQVQADPSLKAEVLAILKRGGLYKLVETAFALTPEQKKQMRTSYPLGRAALLARNLAEVVENGGDVVLAIERPNTLPADATALRISEATYEGNVSYDPQTSTTTAGIKVTVKKSE